MPALLFCLSIKSLNDFSKQFNDSISFQFLLLYTLLCCHCDKCVWFFTYWSIFLHLISVCIFLLSTLCQGTSKRRHLFSTYILFLVRDTPVGQIKCALSHSHSHSNSLSLFVKFYYNIRFFLMMIRYKLDENILGILNKFAPFWEVKTKTIAIALKRKALSVSALSHSINE